MPGRTAGAPSNLGASVAAQDQIAAVFTAGLGGAASYLKTDTGTKTIVAAHATKDRACLIVVHIDETYADAGGTQPVLKIGETSTIEKGAAATVFVDAPAGSVFVFPMLNTATKAIIATLTAGLTTGTGGFTISVIAIPTT